MAKVSCLNFKPTNAKKFYKLYKLLLLPASLFVIKKSLIACRAWAMRKSERDNVANIPNDQAELGTPNSQNQTSSPRIVWLVDDDDTYRVTLKQLLNLERGLNCPHDFSTAPLVLNALQLLAPPDVILLDDEMPGMTGIEAIPHIRQLAPAAAVLMFSTFKQNQRVKAALSAGASDFLAKSESFEIFLTALRSAKASPLPVAAMPWPMAKGIERVQRFFRPVPAVKQSAKT